MHAVCCRRLESNKAPISSRRSWEIDSEIWHTSAFTFLFPSDIVFVFGFVFRSLRTAKFPTTPHPPRKNCVGQGLVRDSKDTCAKSLSPNDGVNIPAFVRKTCDFFGCQVNSQFECRISLKTLQINLILALRYQISNMCAK